MKPFIFLGALAISLSLAVPAFADWEIQNPADYSAAGALSVGVGVLQTIAAPVQLTGELLDSQNPVDASGKAARNLSDGVSATGIGVVYLLEGTRQGLSELTVDSIKAGSVLVGTTVEAINDSIPKVTITFSDKGQPTQKTIPLVVRKQYVQMHEKLEDQPCP